VTEALAARRIVPAGIAIIGVTYGLARYAYGLFVPDIRADFHLTTTALGAIASGSYASYLIAVTVSGALAERVGPRRLIAAGGLAAAGGMAVVGAAPNAAVLVTALVVAGSGSGLVWPALSDAIARLVHETGRARAFALTNSGTCYAVALAGPIALLAGDRWRAAWLVFAALAVTATAWSVASLPRGPLGGSSAEPFGLRGLASREAAPLLVLAFAFGATNAAYWTFAVDLTVAERGLDPASGVGRVFLTIVGVAGVLGGAAGELVALVGLARTLVGGVLGAAGAMALLPATGGSWAGVAASGILFGASFIVVAGAAAIWAVRVFAGRPAAGVAALTFVFTVGSIIGPVVLGALGEAAGLATAFYVAAALTAAGTLAAVRAPR
jgi:predicted MFS family arabinose efflux permease